MEGNPVNLVDPSGLCKCGIKIPNRFYTPQFVATSEPYLEYNEWRQIPVSIPISMPGVPSIISWGFLELHTRNIDESQYGDYWDVDVCLVVTQKGVETVIEKKQITAFHVNLRLNAWEQELAIFVVYNIERLNYEHYNLGWYANSFYGEKRKLLASEGDNGIWPYSDLKPWIY